MPIDPNTTNKTTLDARPELGRDLDDADVLAVHDGADLKKVLASRLKTYLSTNLGLRYVTLSPAPNGATTNFTIPNTIAAIGDWIPLTDGVAIHPDDFTWNLATGTFVFDVAPASGEHLTAFGVGVDI